MQKYINRRLNSSIDTIVDVTVSWFIILYLMKDREI